MGIIEMKNVNFFDNKNKIIEDFNLKIDEGDYISIVGPSGSGKSTILRLMANLISPTEGELYFKDKNFLEFSPYDLRKTITYCFQTPILFGDTIMDNFKFPFTVRHKPVDKNRIEYLCNLFRIPIDMLDKPIDNLSGGEKQRIALIRSILFKPDVLLLDEVTSALDHENTLIVEEVIEKLNKEGITILWVTHNKEQSIKHANKLLTVEQGKLKSFEVIK